MSVPMLFGIMGMVIFNIVDMYFVGKLGTDELAALSFTFPVVLVIGSLSMGLGTGSSAVISRAIGEGNKSEVVRLTTDSLILALLIIGLFVVAGFLTIDPVFRLLGADGEILILIKQYMVVWYAGILFLVFPMVGNAAIRATGDTKTPSMIMVGAALTNVVLDPLLIFGLGPFPRMELEGAAVATVVARGVAFVLGFYVLYFRERMISFEIVPFGEVLESWRRILFIGFPSAASRMVGPLGIGVLTMLVASHGPKAVAAFGVASRFEFIGLVTVFALSVVIGPFVGQNLGAKKYDRIGLAVSFGNRFSLLWGAGVFVLLLIFARPIVSLFSADPEVIESAILYLSIVPISYGFFGMVQIATSALNTLNKPYHAAFVIVFMMFGLCVPLAYAGSKFYGLVGIFGAIAIAFIVAGIMGQVLLRGALSDLRRSVADTASA
jgi:putative MATE family efflux protein